MKALILLILISTAIVKEYLTVQNSMKALALIVLISTAAIADGTDDPNFYRDFNPNDPNPPAKYDQIAPPQWHIKRQNNGNVQPLPDRDCIWSWTGCNRIPKPIPEPRITALLVMGIINLFLYKKLRKKP